MEDNEEVTMFGDSGRATGRRARSAYLALVLLTFTAGGFGCGESPPTRPSETRRPTPPQAQRALADPARGSPPPGRRNERQAVGQHLIYGFRGTTPPPWLVEKIRLGETAGVLITGENTASKSQLAGLTDRLQAIPRPRRLDAPLLVMTDQEGGLVHRVPGPPGYSQEEVGRWRSLDRVRQLGLATGRNLRSVGINTNLAPIVDIARPGSIRLVQHRAYSSDLDRVIRTARSYILGMRSAGVLATLKHFPGLGSAPRDEDIYLNRDHQSLARLRGFDEAPFRALGNDAGLVMTSTGVYRPFGRLPSDLNPRIVAELRLRVGFRGLVLTDALETPSLAEIAPTATRAELALRADNDLLLVTYDDGADPYFRGALRALRHSRLNRSRLAASLRHVLAVRRALPPRASRKP